LADFPENSRVEAPKMEKICADPKKLLWRKIWHSTDFILFEWPGPKFSHLNILIDHFILNGKFSWWEKGIIGTIRDFIGLPIYQCFSPVNCAELGNSLGNITCLEDFGVFLAFLTKRQK
jgi:hypothetical protein